MDRIILSMLMLSLVLFIGCFTPQLMNSSYQAPVESLHEFTDEFDSPMYLEYRWKRIAGWWKVRDGMLSQTIPWKSSLPGFFQMIYVDGLASGPYRVETRLNLVKEGEQSAGILLRFQDQNNFYLLRMRHYPRWQDYIDLTQYENGIRKEDLRRSDLPIRPGVWYNLRAEDDGREIVAYLDRMELFRYPTPDKAVGTVGLAVSTGVVSFDHFSARYMGNVSKDDRISRSESIQMDGFPSQTP